MPAAKVRAQMKALGDVLVLSCGSASPFLVVIAVGSLPSLIRGAFGSSSSSAMLSNSYAAPAVLAVRDTFSFMYSSEVAEVGYRVYVTLTA